MKYLQISPLDMRTARNAGNEAVGLPARGESASGWEPPELQLDEFGDYMATQGWTTDCYASLHLGADGALYVGVLPEYEAAIPAVQAAVSCVVLDALPAEVVRVTSDELRAIEASDK